MKIEQEVQLDFSDVLIKPKRSEAPSRADVNLNRSFTNGKTDENALSFYGTPIVASNLDTTGTFEMARVLNKHNMFTCLHKHYDIPDLVNFFQTDQASIRCFYTLGIKEEDIEKFKTVVQKAGTLPLICIDVANGYTKYFVDKLKIIREMCPKSFLMAGNVATPEMVQELIIAAGVNMVKVGIGPGALCTTRIVTGVGVPQLSAIIECADAAHGAKAHICADGGCSTSGDIAKAFGAGGDFVMLGGMLTGHDECSGEFVMEGEKKIGFKSYGMSSQAALDKYNGGTGNYRAPEGRSATVPYRGPVENTVQNILGGLRSACTYVGADKLKDLPKCTTFIRCNRTHNRIFE